MKMTEDRYNELQARNSKTPGRIVPVSAEALIDRAPIAERPKVTACHLWQQEQCPCTPVSGCQNLDAAPVEKPMPAVFRSGREKPSKYRNVKSGTYASKKEAKRAAELKMLEAAGQIRNLQEQVPIVLLPTQREGGDPLKGKVLERACTIKMDFVYEEAPGWEVVFEDVKGFKTEVYNIKKKMVLWNFGKVIRET